MISKKQSTADILLSCMMGPICLSKENILKTKAVVEYAHAHGVSVEGELGTIGGTEEGIHVAENDKVYTRPEDAVKFVEATGVDALAIAIGTNHGQFKSKQK